MMLRRAAAGLAAAGVVLLSAASPAIALPRDFPDLDAVQLSSSEQQQVADYVGGLIEEIRGAESMSERARAWRTLQADLLDEPDLGVPMRLAIADAHIQAIRDLAVSDDDHAAAIGLLMAGKVATRGCGDVLADGFEDDRPAVRGAAASGAEAMLRALSNAQGAVIRAPGPELHDRLGSALRDEADAAVARLIVAALGATPDDPEFHASAMQDLARAMADRSARLAREGRVEGLLAGELMVFRVALTHLRDYLVDPASQFSDEELRQAMTASAMAIAMVRDAARTLDDPDELALFAPSEQDALGRALGRATDVVGTAEQLTGLAYLQLTNRSAPTVRLSDELDDAVERGSYGGFLDAANEMIELVTSPAVGGDAELFAVDEL